jgi:hypothetical protein
LTRRLQTTFDLVAVELHIGARRIGQTDRSVDGVQRMFQEMHVNGIPFDEIFLIGRMNRRLRHAEMDAHRRRMAVRNRDEIVGRRIGGDLQRLAEAAAPVNVGLQNIEGVLLDEALEAPTRIFVLGARQRNASLGL